GFLLQDISFSIGKGETLGILGATGSGKSTLLRLLLRFYSPDSGKILVGGTDITTLSAKELRRHFGVVFQNDILFAGTVADNLNFDRSISMEDIEKAIKNSCADEFIDDPATEVAIKGANFSGGQKQRLMIARALAGSPDILILDDSSSALDYLTDAQLRENLATITDSTKIIIAQRVSSIMHSQRILVIDEGKIIGCGSHAELMESCAVYRETYEVQMGGAEND
ncbi:MAG: ABC transporter ATP-binding protein, partial [Oscillospiraceae bacterium]|nr:ABC transporter ATP-binding protein [Oscillospiraceae bacterium]